MGMCSLGLFSQKSYVLRLEPTQLYLTRPSGVSCGPLQHQVGIHTPIEGVR
jgi:hypothetical protein